MLRYPRQQRSHKRRVSVLSDEAMMDVTNTIDVTLLRPLTIAITFDVAKHTNDCPYLLLNLQKDYTLSETRQLMIHKL